MAAKTQTLTFKRTIAQPAREVYRAFTRASVIRTWFCDAAQLDAHKGGRVFLHWNNGDYRMLGSYTATDPHKKVAFTWHGSAEPAATQVQVTLKENAGAEASLPTTKLTLTHSGIGSGKAWAGIADVMRSDWNDALDNLKSVLETGEDLRIVRRPMLGIMGMSELDDETATKLGVPIKRGIRIGGTVAGMGAHAAGLRADDVVVSIGKTKLSRFPHIADALGRCHAGDTVPVTFYRGTDKLTLPMTLSRRPIPAMPATGAELAEQVRQVNAHDGAELAKLFEGVSEDAAGKRLAAEEWSAKEVITHLITSERGLTDFISEAVTDSEPWFDDFDNDVNVYPAGLLKVYPTVSALLEALKRAESETAALLEALPADFIARKRNYWRICFGLLQGPTHVQQHFAQIQSAIEAANGK